MITDLLERLKSDEFAFTVGFLVPSPALRGKLGAMKEVENVVAAIAGGELSEDTLRHFVSTLMKELRKGERFPYDLALAALAVALEGRATKFAQEYLQDLADLGLAELSTSSRVARECLKHRTSLSEAIRNGASSVSR